MFYFGRILRLAELMRLLELKPRKWDKFLHAIVYLAQDAGIIESYSFELSSEENVVFSAELEEELETLAACGTDIVNKSLLDFSKVMKFKDFLKKTEKKVVELAFNAELQKRGVKPAKKIEPQVRDFNSFIINLRSKSVRSHSGRNRSSPVTPPLQMEAKADNTHKYSL